MGTSAETQLLQSQVSLSRSASLANAAAGKTERVPDARSSISPRGSTAPAQPGVRIAIFFDGTGNNLDADVGTGEHSNVARLFRAHVRDDPSQGVFRYYVPGIGTRFKDIGDPGAETRGVAFAARGTARLDWAMRRLEECLVQSRGRTLHLALFGFSRGAALARAFARLVAHRCERGSDGGWRISHQKAESPFRLYFMGLFDTVASVGAPMGTNNLQSIDLTTGAMDLRQALHSRHVYGSTLDDIAFADGGAPGADPAEGMSNGHVSWADDLRIPELVEDCLHMVAAHEIRNSFPVDSVLNGPRYPRNCRERLYPGAHSDVGGGYRRGEGARSPSPGSSLSLIPLRHMRAEAIAAGVPLLPQMRSENLMGDFAEDPASKGAFETLCRRFDLYMRSAGLGEKSMGSQMLSHMNLYYQWRFSRIASGLRERSARREIREQAVLQEKAHEPTWASERTALKGSVEQARLKAEAQKLMARKLESAGMRWTPSGRALVDSHVELAEQLEDRYLSEKARLDTLPTSDGSFARNVNVYDDQLLDDARRLQAFAKQKGRGNLRPHYKALLEAYEAEVERRQGALSQELNAFFDTYVHDSLSGFAMDATLPSDPRVIYVGGDRKLQYAFNPPTRRGLPTSALG